MDPEMQRFLEQATWAQTPLPSVSWKPPAAAWAEPKQQRWTRYRLYTHSETLLGRAAKHRAAHDNLLENGTRMTLMGRLTRIFLSVVIRKNPCHPRSVFNLLKK
jgi:hypothetical protein